MGGSPREQTNSSGCPLEAKNELTLVSLLYPINEKYRRLSSRPGRVVLSIDSGVHKKESPFRGLSEIKDLVFDDVKTTNFGV